MPPKLSIVVPVYNVERYLRQCLDSLINQTLDDIEIILVNDGSTDGSTAMLEQYAERDKRIILINKPNSGYGHTMNTGFDRATGDYIGILESDDFADVEMFETLYKTATQHDLDIARCHYFHHHSLNNTNERCDCSWVPANTVFSPLEDPAPFYQAPAIWASIYRKEMIRENDIRFLETPGASYQDTSFAFKVYACCKRFMMIDDCLLYYRIDNDSSSVKNVGKFMFVVDEYHEIERFLDERQLNDRLAEIKNESKVGCYLWNFERLPYPINYRFAKIISRELRQACRLGQLSAHATRRTRLLRKSPLLFVAKHMISRTSNG